MPQKETLSASLEDYLGSIYRSQQESGVARSKDIAADLGVQRASVTGALRALSEKGLINYRPYSHVTLTDDGLAAAKELTHRRATLKELFTTILQLDAQTAGENACRVEHAVDPQVIGKLVDFLDFVSRCPRLGADWLKAWSGGCTNDGRCEGCAECLSRLDKAAADLQLNTH